MAMFICGNCGWVYNPRLGVPDDGIAPGTPFADISEEWRCPVCGMDKTAFSLFSELL
ncbi:MAG: rubredoxin [Planctomycetes bacterium]|nr:rubredoxin [Planctomycetota bacterium]